jgi:hypothetical protein
MKKYYRGEKKHLDDEKIEQGKEDLKNIRSLMDSDASDELVLAYFKGMKPDVKASELQILLGEFRRRKAERRAELVAAKQLREKQRPPGA